MDNVENFLPNWSSKPGNTIVDILQEQRLSINGFAEKMDQPLEYINQLISGYTSITDEIAFQLENVLGASAEFWLKREYQYRENVERLKKLGIDWLNELPLRDMLQYGWIPHTRDRVAATLEFFNVPDVDTWRRKYEKTKEAELVAFRTSPSFTPKLGSVAAWLRQGEIIGNSVQCKPWNPELFQSSLAHIKSLTKQKNPKKFLPALKQICAECGVAVAIVRTPKGCHASGAAKFVSPTKALILLSFRYLSDDQFWFTFFHEAGHLLLHGGEEIFLEGMPFKTNSNLQEEEANAFAGEMLIPHELQQKLSRLRRVKREIIGFAMLAGVSPGIVVGQMQHHRYIRFDQLNYYKRDYDWEDIDRVPS